MDTVLYTAIGIILGGIITYLVSRYYYKKGIKAKSLTPFLQFISGVLTEVDPEVKTKLEVHYDDQKVIDLYQAQFVIANTGDVPIRDCIKPLTLEIPEGGQVLDVSILYVEPEGRQVSYEITRRDNGNSLVAFSFPLLNGSEFFITKLLINGKLPSSQPSGGDKASEKRQDVWVQKYFDIAAEYKFRITVDDLPPVIVSKRLPYQYEVEQSPRKFSWQDIVGALSFGFCSLCLAYVFYSVNDPLSIFHLSQFFGNFSLISVAVIVGWLLTLFLLIGSISIFVGTLTDFRPKRKPKFTIPKKLSRREYPFLDKHKV